MKTQLSLSLAKDTGDLFVAVDNYAICFTLEQLLSQLLALVLIYTVPGNGGSNKENDDGDDYVYPILLHFKYIFSFSLKESIIIIIVTLTVTTFSGTGQGRLLDPDQLIELTEHFEYLKEVHGINEGQLKRN